MTEERPDLSLVVVVYNIPREAPQTLLSLSSAYQRFIDARDYEVIVVDNGSQPPVDHRLISRLSGNFRLIRIDGASPSPAHAVNRGIAEARGEIVGVMIDGARIVTPGLLHFARHGVRLHENAVVAALGWYLGGDFQRFAMREGYDRAREDALLKRIGWPEDGYRLFEIGTPDDSSFEGWFQPIAEANALFMRRASWEALEGVDERFDAPGGGLANLDLYARALELRDARPVVLIGEGTFHQLHGGIATNSTPEQLAENWKRWAGQFESIRGRSYTFPVRGHLPTYVGTLPPAALAHFVRAAVAPIRGNDASPLGRDFDQRLWAATAPTRPADPTIAAVIDLAQREFGRGRFAATASIARLIRGRAPSEWEPQRLLSLTAPALELGQPLAAEYFLAMGEAHRLLGENEAAATQYRKALTLNGSLVEAHVGLSHLRMPGDFYLEWLDRLYSTLAPAMVLEIGVFEGASLSRVRPPTVAIGVDPNPKVIHPLKAETHIFPETSDHFFARRGLDGLLDGRPLGIGLIDGLHLYEQALRDFINLERCCGPRSVILLHDTVPLDEATQSRACNTGFHTGDVWKTVLCLRHYRPDLDVFTIATAWSGLTVVTRLDPASRVLAERYEEAVARFIETPFSTVDRRLEEALGTLPNEWAPVKARLESSRVL